ncbi:5-oxoprolinase subunit PxpA [Flavobacteriaceae bacterium]|nr:5-oxoprolinase subunit PxpA [Flavobacteriaceae bacterium]|tara:strand:- start:1204 stop:1917 length:714 start_codon:yes stop_codon:yes gene_type:complete
MLNINCDLGEGLNNEHIIMPLINSCNIACGGHAGDNGSMIECVEISIKNNVKIGAHPSYPDKINFGRKKIDISPSQLSYSIISQIESLETIADSYGLELNHIKAHGALYNQMIIDTELSNFYLNTIKDFKNKCSLYIPYKSEIEKIALKKGFSIIYEVFGDRNYNDDLSLVSRSNENALITDPESVVNHIKTIKETETVKTINGNYKKIKFDTICIHSDTNNSIEILKKINQEFDES